MEKQKLGELSAGLPKVVRRFVTEAIYGIKARQSVRLTSIARSLGEKIALKRTHYRLCRQLGRAGLWQKLTHALRVLEGLGRILY